MTLAHANIILIGIPLLKHAIAIIFKVMQKFNRDVFIVHLVTHQFLDVNVLKDLYGQIFI